MCFNPSPVRRVPSPNRYIAVAKFCFCKNNKRLIDVFISGENPFVPGHETPRSLSLSVTTSTPQRAIATLAQRPARHAHGATPRKSGSPAGTRRHRGLCRIAGRLRPRATTPCRSACPPIAHGPPQNFVLFSQDNVTFDSTLNPALMAEVNLAGAPSTGWRGRRALAALVSAGLIFLLQSEIFGESNALQKSSELLSRASTLLWPSTRAPLLTKAESSLASDGGQSNHPQNPALRQSGGALQALAFKWPVLSAHAPTEASVVAKQTMGANHIYDWPGMTPSPWRQDFKDSCYASLDDSTDEP